MLKKLLGSVFAILVAISMVLPVFSFVAQANDSISTEDTVFDTPSLDSDFADDRVLVVMTRDASMDLNTYTTSNFANLGCTMELRSEEVVSQTSNDAEYNKQWGA